MDKAQKRELVTALNEVFSDAGVIVVAHYSGLSVSEMTEFRSRAREAGAQVKVAKNRLAKLALEGTEVSGIAELFTGPTCITYSNDLVAAPKAPARQDQEGTRYREKPRPTPQGRGQPTNQVARGQVLAIAQKKGLPRCAPVGQAERQGVYQVAQIDQAASIAQPAQGQRQARIAKSQEF